MASSRMPGVWPLPLPRKYTVYAIPAARPMRICETRLRLKTSPTTRPMTYRITPSIRKPPRRYQKSARGPDGPAGAPPEAERVVSLQRSPGGVLEQLERPQGREEHEHRPHRD